MATDLVSIILVLTLMQLEQYLIYHNDWCYIS